MIESKKSKIAHAILTDDMEGNLVECEKGYVIYTCKKCKRDFIIELEDGTCQDCKNKPFLKKIIDKFLSGR